MSIFEEFKWRGLLKNATEGLEEQLTREKTIGYIGFDPTADSLHVGSLLPIMCLARLQTFGHGALAIIGGGTGMIGDPSGKTQERQLLTHEKVEENLRGIKGQLSRFLDFEDADNPAQIINNADWLGEITLIDFLRDAGKHFTINYMLSKESAKRRLEQESGLSFTEFSYMLLQAYDFLVLFDRYDCTLQLGGSDQWGNITAGAELIRKLRPMSFSPAQWDAFVERHPHAQEVLAPVLSEKDGRKVVDFEKLAQEQREALGDEVLGALHRQGRAHGMVFPLVTTSAGIKFGKTEAGAVWLDANRTSPYNFYQFWLKTDDRDVIKYLKYFTWLDQEEVATYEKQVEEEPHKRSAQKRLAEEVTRIVHGEDLLQRAISASKVLFGGELDNLSADDIVDIFSDVPSNEVTPAALEGEGIALVDLLEQSGLVKSKGEGRRSIKGGGVYLNNQRVEDGQKMVTSEDAIEGRFLILRKGKKKYHLVRVQA